MNQVARTVLRTSYAFVINLGYRIYGIEFVANVLSRIPTDMMHATLRTFRANIGLNLIHKDGWLIDNADRDFSNLQIGNNCYVGKSVFFDLPRQIILEDEVVISARVMFITHADTGNRVMSSWYPRIEGSIRIGRGSWIGAGAIILPGIELGECCVVGAGSVVNKSWPARSVVAGVPARLLKTLPDHPTETIINN